MGYLKLVRSTLERQLFNSCLFGGGDGGGSGGGGGTVEGIFHSQFHIIVHYQEQ